jgi:hypothetical protein
MSGASFESPIIYATPQTLQNCLELDFLLYDLLPGIDLTIRPDVALQHKTIIYLEYDIDLNFSVRVKSLGRKLILIHLGDETAIKDLSAYDLANSIFRNYFHEKIFSNNSWEGKIFWLPNGYRNGLRVKELNKPKVSSSRTSLASFIGWLSNQNSIKNERFDFKAAADKSSGILNCIPTAGFAAGYSTHLYAHVMESSIFAPCPAGNAPETIRLFDVLELGCIPITTKHRFLSGNPCLVDPPFIFINEWNELPIKLARMSQQFSTSPEIFNSNQRQCLDYWRSTKAISRLQLTRCIG